MAGDKDRVYLSQSGQRRFDRAMILRGRLRVLAAQKDSRASDITVCVEDASPAPFHRLKGKDDRYLFHVIIGDDLAWTTENTAGLL